MHMYIYNDIITGCRFVRQGIDLARQVSVFFARPTENGFGLNPDAQLVYLCRSIYYHQSR